MNCLILGALNKGALEWNYLFGLQQCGVETEAFDITADYYHALERSVLNRVINKISPRTFFEPINLKVKEYLEGKHFDVILVFKGLALFPVTIELLKQHGRLVCCYNPDHPFNFYSEGSGNANILESIRQYHIYFSYAERITRELKTKYAVNSYTVPFGFDDRPFTPVEPPAALADKYLFIGSYDSERAGFLNRLGEQDIAVYGDNKWRTKTPKNSLAGNAYQGRALYDDEYKQALKMGRGIFNLLRRQNIVEGSHNMRTFEVPGYGGLLISDRTPEQQGFFEEDKEAIYFGSIEELRDKLQYLNAHPSRVNAIKQAALQRAQSSHYSYRHRSRQLYNYLNSHL